MPVGEVVTKMVHKKTWLLGLVLAGAAVAGVLWWRKRQRAGGGESDTPEETVKRTQANV